MSASQLPEIKFLQTAMHWQAGVATPTPTTSVLMTAPVLPELPLVGAEDGGVPGVGAVAATSPVVVMPVGGCSSREQTG
jgi:hypothetical protein